MAASLADKWALWKVALLAFVSMCIVDVLSTVMVVFESRYNAPGAALMDVLGYFASLACSVLALDSILKNGVRNKRSLVIIGAVSLANAAGTVGGVYLSRVLS